jgi:hypothetical protein
MSEKKTFIAGYREYAYCIFVDLSEIVALETTEEREDEESSFDRCVYAYLKSGHKVKLCMASTRCDLENYCLELIERIGTWNEFEHGNMEGKLSWLDSKGEIVE